MASGMVHLYQLILFLGVFDRSLVGHIETYQVYFIGLLLMQALWSDFELSTVDDMNGTTGLPLVFDLRSKRIKNGLYGISGTVTVTDSLDGYDVRSRRITIYIYHENSMILSPLINHIYIDRSETVPKHQGRQRLEAGAHHAAPSSRLPTRGQRVPQVPDGGYACGVRFSIHPERQRAAVSDV